MRAEPPASGAEFRPATRRRLDATRRKSHAESLSRSFTMILVEHPAPRWHRIDRAGQHREGPGMHANRILIRFGHDCDRCAYHCDFSSRAFVSSSPNPRLPPSAMPLGTTLTWFRCPISQAGGLSFKGGVDWINSGPISLTELRGKIVLLDFWTFCCINCHHVLPDLAKLEEKYKNELVVIGVHTGQVRRRARDREHPPQGGRIPDQASGRQRRQPGRSGTASASIAGRPWC